MEISINQPLFEWKTAILSRFWMVFDCKIGNIDMVNLATASRPFWWMIASPGRP